jgi:hypothetical protein
MDVAAVLEALGDRPPDEPAVLVRLFLMVDDGETGEPTHVSTFVRRIAMPPSMVTPDVEVALDVGGERHVFTPERVVWDETHRVCILEVIWVVSDEPTPVDLAAPERAWS